MKILYVYNFEPKVQMAPLKEQYNIIVREERGVVWCGDIELPGCPQ